jgi:hypothetical protein
VVRFCETGPASADVDRVEVSEEQPEGADGFQVR